MPQPLILTWATTPSGWTQHRPRYVLSSSLGESTYIRGYPWALEAQPTYSKPKNGPDGIPQICTCIHGQFVNHQEKNTRQAPSKMETVLTRLHDARLKVNAAKSLFCAHEIEFGYILTREEINPKPKRV